jgi:plastocyanin
VCCPATGNLGDTVNEADIGATVLVLHNSYNDAGTLLPLIAHIKAGQAVQWKWASSHCHSVTAEDGSFESGFFYPTTRPAQMEAVHGFLDYPLPDPNPSLTYTHTFAAAGQYLYHCVHHQVIGMEGIVIVDP